VDADIGVVGLGAAGSSTLWRLSHRRLSVLGFEQFVPGHPYGSSHGLSRLFRLAALEGPRYVPLGQLARKLWRQLEQETGTEVLTVTGGLMIGHPESGVVAGTLESAKQHDLPYGVLEASELRQRFPQHREIADSDVAVIDPAAGVLRPERALVAAVSYAKAKGAQVLENVRVEAAEPDADGVTVHTVVRSFRVGKLILAVGAWIDRLLPESEFHHRTRRSVIRWFQPLEGCAADFSPDRFPIFVRDIPGSGAWGVPAIDGGLVKVAPTAYPRIETDPDALDRGIYAADAVPGRKYVERYLAGLDPTPVKMEPCMVARSLDDDLILGWHPTLSHVIMAAGLGGLGFKYSVAIGEVCASLATGEASPVPISAFSPERLYSGQERDG
jgi:sarcosine oxidase